MTPHVGERWGAHNKVERDPLSKYSSLFIVHQSGDLESCLNSTEQELP